jgi:3-deoxy-D-manno-octulosonic-acid transferase
LIEHGAARQVKDADELEIAVHCLLADAKERERMETAARAFVQQQQGATEATVRLLGDLLNRSGRCGRLRRPVQL